MASANFLQHGHEKCFGISCMYRAQVEGTEIKHVTEKRQFFILPASVEERVSRVTVQVKECYLLPIAYRGIRDLR